MFSFSSGKYTEVELNHMVVLFFIFLRNFHTVFHSAALIYIPTKRTQVSFSPYLHQHLLLFFLMFIPFILFYFKIYLFICLFLVCWVFVAACGLSLVPLVEWGLLFAVVCGLLIAVASLVAVHGL